jgi:hypothetical protein
MKRYATKSTYWLLLATLLSLTSLAHAKHTEPPPDPKFSAIGQIVILPVVDARVDKKAAVDLQKLRETAEKNLKKKNYQVSESDNGGPVGQVIEDDLKEAKPDWVKGLGPADARWVMVVGLSDMATKVTLGSTANVEVMGFLYDKASGTTVWNGRGIGRAGQGGLFGMAIKGAIKSEALTAAIYNLLNSVPQLPKTK